MNTLPEDAYGAKEIEKRREDALKRMLATPHKPHAPLKAKKPTPSRAKTATAKPRKKT